MRPGIPTTRTGAFECFSASLTGHDSLSEMGRPAEPWKTALRGKGLAWRSQAPRVADVTVCRPEAQVGQVIKVPDGLCHFYEGGPSDYLAHTPAHMCCPQGQEVMSTRVDCAILHNTA